MRIEIILQRPLFVRLSKQQAKPRKLLVFGSITAIAMLLGYQPVTGALLLFFAGDQAAVAASVRLYPCHR
jgi:hypothetical protein